MKGINIKNFLDGEYLIDIDFLKNNINIVLLKGNFKKFLY